jgi:WD40 repeat protein
MSRFRKLVLALTCLGVGGIQPASADRPAADAPKPPGPAKAVRTDRYGDPLPPGAVARLGTARLRPGFVNLLAFLPGGRQLLAVSLNERGASVTVMDGNNGKLVGRFEVASLRWNSMALSPDARTLAATVYDRAESKDRLTLWDIASGKEIRPPPGLGAGGYVVAFAPDGKTLATAGRDQVVRLWDVATGAERLRFQGTQNVWHRLVFSPDGKRLTATGSRGSSVPVWEVASGKELYSLEGPRSGFAAAPDFSPDGKLLATAASDDPAIRLWDTATGNEVRRLRGEPETRCLRFSPDGKTLAAGGWPQEGLSLDGGQLRLWDVATGREVRRLVGHALGVNGLAFSADGRQLASAGAGVIRLWEVATGKELLPLAEPEGYVASVAFSRQARTLATGGADGTIRLWEAATGEPVRGIKGGYRERAWQVRFSPDGHTLASAGDDGPVRLWDPATGREVGRLRGHRGGALYVNFAPDGRTLISCGRDNTVRLWDAATGKELCRLAGGTRQVFNALISPDGKLLTAISEDRNGSDGEVVLWESATGKELRRWPVRDIGAIAFSPNGRCLAGIEGDASGEVPRTVHLWDVARGTACSHATPPTHRPFCLAFSPDGRMLAWGDMAGSLTLWEVATAQGRCRLVGHRSLVRDLSFSPDGKLLASASFDTTALVWDPAALARRTGPLSPADCQMLWSDLAGADAARAYQAVATLAAAPQQALSLLREHLTPAAAVDRRRIARLIGELESDEFAVREKAMNELTQLGDTAEVSLREASAARPALELRRRLDQLLDKLQGPVTAPERLRQLRAVEVLEHVGSPEAREVLEKLAGGAPEARLTREARAALDRLARRPTGPP